MVQSLQIWWEFDCTHHFVDFTAVQNGDVLLQLKHNGQGQEFFGGGPLLLVKGQTFCDEVRQGLGVDRADLVVDSRLDLLVKTLCVLGSEWGLEHAHFVQDATQGPDVTFIIIRFFVPDLGGGVVRSSGLSHGEGVLQVLGHIEVSNFGISVVEEYVGGLDVPVDDVLVVKLAESF